MSFLKVSLRTPLIVSEAVVRNSDSLSTNSLSVSTFSVRLLSLTHCLYFDKRLLLNFRCRVMYNDPFPSSASCLASFKFTTIPSSSSENLSRSFSLSSLTGLNKLSSSSLSVRALRCPPYFRSNRDFAASYAAAE